MGVGIVEKKKISAKDALADIRSGMSDANLMSKYLLSNAGLQSLFDKLVTAGYIDLEKYWRGRQRFWNSRYTRLVSAGRSDQT